MRKPVVAIVGQPNVGKSTLANRLLGHRQAIVDSTPGVTRDRLYFDVEWTGYHFTVIDTGGLIPGSDDEIATSVHLQVNIATKQADLVLFLVDGPQGLTPVDEEIANILRRLNKPVFLVVNKIDTPGKEVLKSEFYKLALGEPFTISAIQGTGGVGDLLDAIIEKIDKVELPDEEHKIPRFAIVGRPNVGKSTIINFLLKEQRVIVSDKSGTTRDSIDTMIKLDDNEFILTDTAGIRKRAKVEKGIEYYSVKRALDAITNSDVTILITEASEGITDQDKKIAEYSNESGNGLVIVVNKWDLISDKNTYTINEFTKRIKEELPHADFAEIVFTNAISGQRLSNIIALARKAFENNSKKISTTTLNQVIIEAMAISPPKSVGDKRLKIYYSTQVNINPPTFMMFINKEKLFMINYKRYIENQLRQAFDLTGTPIKIVVTEKTARNAQKIKKRG